MWRGTVGVVCCLVVGAGVGACGGGGHSPRAGAAGAVQSVHRAGGAPHSSPRSSAPATASTVTLDPAKARTVDDGQKVLFRTQGQRGPEELTTLARISQGTLGVQVVCSGPGRIRVRLGAIASFEADCGSGAAVYNEIALTSARNDVTVSVAGAPTDEWALSLSWTPVIAPLGG